VDRGGLGKDQQGAWEPWKKREGWRQREKEYFLILWLIQSHAAKSLYICSVFLTN
jgi:hypothetical protein